VAAVLGSGRVSNEEARTTGTIHAHPFPPTIRPATVLPCDDATIVEVYSLRKASTHSIPRDFIAVASVQDDDRFGPKPAIGSMAASLAGGVQPALCKNAVFSPRASKGTQG
jgi:hypothetical protein